MSAHSVGVRDSDVHEVGFDWRVRAGYAALIARAGQVIFKM